MASSRRRGWCGSGRALLVWNGDWIQTPGQAGKGLAGVRQAIALEVAFAPEACRRQTMRGLVVVSFAGGQRVVFGTGSWRWQQMLGGRQTAEQQTPRTTAMGGEADIGSTGRSLLIRRPLPRHPRA